MANEQNLIPFDQRTEKEKREIATKGGIASGEARRAKRDFRESMIAALAEMVDRRDDKGVLLAKIPAQDAICLKQIAKALKGDTTAAKFCADIADEKRGRIPLGGFQFVMESGDDEI